MTSTHWRMHVNKITPLVHTLSHGWVSPRAVHRRVVLQPGVDEASQDEYTTENGHEHVKRCPVDTLRLGI